MAGPGGHRRRPADGRARRVDRDDRSAVGPESSAHLRRRSSMGHHRLHPCLRRPAAARRPDRRLHGSQADVRRRPDRLRCRLRARGGRPERGDVVRGPGPAGCVRRPHGAGRPVADHRHLHRAHRAGQGLRRLRRDRRRRCGDRPNRRWGAHAVRHLALVPTGQCARRRPDRPLRGPARPGEPGGGQHPLRHPRRHRVVRRPGVAGLRVHQGHHRRLGIARPPWPS